METSCTNKSLVTFMKKVDQTHTHELGYKQRSAARELIKLPWLQNPIVLKMVGKRYEFVVIINFKNS